MIFFLLPAVNEAESIANTLKNIHAEMQKIQKFLDKKNPEISEYKIIVCDNNSSDKTAEISEKNNAIVVHEKIPGYGHTLMKGVSYIQENFPEISDAEKILVFMDADGQDSPENIAQHLQNLEISEFSIASRIPVGADSIRQSSQGGDAVSVIHTFVNQLFGFLLKLRTGKNFSDLGPFRALNMKTFLSLEMQELTFGWTAEMQKKIALKNISYREFYSAPKQRYAGESKVSGSAIWKQIKIGCQIIWVIVK